MTEQVSPLITFYKHGWEHHQQALVKTIASLSSEQLTLPIAPHNRSIGGLLDHMIGARFNWFHLWMVWHVMEHEIHHGGELSLALGTYGVESFYTW